MPFLARAAGALPTETTALKASKRVETATRLSQGTLYIELIQVGCPDTHESVGGVGKLSG